MVICIDVTEMLNVNFVSGIQRVVKEILVRWIQNQTFEIHLLKYDFAKECFIIVDNEKFWNFIQEKFYKRKNC